MQNSMNSILIFIFSLFVLLFFFFFLCFRSDKRTNPFFANFLQKIKVVSLSVNSVILNKVNSTMQNSMVIFNFLLLFLWDWKYRFWENLVQKIKIASWSWNLVIRLTQISKIQWWWSFFLLFIGNTLFGQIQNY